MLAGEWGDECVRCEREFSTTAKSRNMYERSAEWAKDITYEKTKALTQPDGTINTTDFPVVFLDLRFGNKCNLKCVMCSPTDSDRWYDDYVAIWGKTTCSGGGSKVSLTQNQRGKYIITDNSMNWFTDKKIWDTLKLHMGSITRIYVAGGEPTLISEHFDFLQQCIDHGYSKNMCIEYNSNISTIPAQAWEIWGKFKQIIIGCSVDGIGEINNLIRFPSKWEKIEATLNKLYNAPSNFLFHLTVSNQILNIWNFPEFIDYMFKHSNRDHPLWVSSPLKMSVHPVHNPPFLNISILPNEFKEKIIQKFYDYIDRIESTDFTALYGESKIVSWQAKIDDARKMLHAYINFLNLQSFSEDELPSIRKNFIYYMDALDKLRGTNWSAVCPEVYNATINWRDNSQ